jgi:hypothetical protein
MFALHRKGEENTNKINTPEFDGEQTLKWGVGSKWDPFD